MRSAWPRACKFAAIAAILALAGLQVLQSLGDPWRACAAVALACAGLMGIAAGEFAAGSRREPPPPAPPAPPPTPEAVMKQAMDRVLAGIRGYLEDNLVYCADLEDIDAGLASVSDPARARDAIATLRAANRRMETKSTELSGELEAARREIVSLRETVNEVERLTLLDALTQVGNRRFFDSSLQSDIAICAASGADLCLAIADIDRFKTVNDRFGHVVGDHLLKSFAEMLTSATKGRAKTARYGGEEFALLFAGVSLPEARRIVETLRRDLEAKRWFVGPSEQPLGVVTASFGLAKLAPGEDAESLVNRADARLMRAKALGRNRVVADDGAAQATPARAQG
jgi:diguanylate cyclase